MNLVEIALMAQLAFCESSNLTPDNIEVHEYRAQVNWQQVEEANKNYDPKAPRSPFPDSDWMGFVFSKANIKNEKLHIHAFQPLNADGKPVDEIWMKLRHPNALDEVFTCDTKVSNDFSNTLLSAIQAQKGTSALAALKPVDNRINAGPVWLEQVIEKEVINGETMTKIPVGTSPPNTPKRFAGIVYIKFPLK